MVFGHKNPDTDSVTSAIALAQLRCRLGNIAIPYVLGDLNEETKFVLEYFKVAAPEKLDNIKIQIKDLNYDRVKPLKLQQSIYHAYNYMNENKLTTLPVINDEKRFIGLLTMTDIAMSLINGEFKQLNSTYDNALVALSATQIVRISNNIEGKIVVAALEAATIKKSNALKEKNILIVGDRLDIVHHALMQKVGLIIITGGRTLPEKYITLAINRGVNIMSTIHHTFETTKLITLTNMVGTILSEKQMIPFQEEDYLDDCKESIETSRHSKFAVVDKENYYKGIIGRAHIIHPGQKDVILVDHNEYNQSAEGIEQANILEVIDHHKIGDISTTLPITFRNLPYGSTNTIIFYLYKEHSKDIPNDIAGLMISGIISDTLLLKSPTTTVYDKLAIQELVKQLNLDLQDYSIKMFEAGTALAGKAYEEIVYNDFKEFVIEGTKIGISQVFTLNLQSILKDKEDYIQIIDEIKNKNDYELVIMVITHITDEGSSFLYSSDSEKLIRSAFSGKIQQGQYVDTIVSRKKQIVPKLMHAFKMLRLDEK